MDPNATGSLQSVLIKILAWYSFSIVSPIANKSVQLYFPYSSTLSVLHLLTATMCGGFYHHYVDRHNPTLKALPRAGVVIRDLLPLGTVKFMSMMLLLFGLKNLPVSLVLTVKALDPIPTAIMSYVILGEWESWLVYSTVLPIITGVMLSTFNTEINTRWEWVMGAFFLVFVDAIQNVLSKRLLKKGIYSETSLQFLSSFTALLFQLPFCLYYEGESLPKALFQNMTLQIFIYLLIACAVFYGQVLMAFTVMNQVTNLTYSVANILKRIAQLLSAVLFFNNPIVPLNAVGMVLAMLGVTCYSGVRLKRSRKR